MNKKVLRIGIIPYSGIKTRTLDIARGKYKHKKTDPKIWFASFKTLGSLLCKKNMILLEIIRDKNPESIKELAQFANRNPSALSVLLKKLARYGFIKLQYNGTNRGKMLKPLLAFNHMYVSFDL